MKKILQIVFIILISIILFLFLPSIFEWKEKDVFDFTKKELTEAIFLGIFTPLAFIFSRKIKNDLIFVLLIVLIISGVLMSVKLLFN